MLSQIVKQIYLFEVLFPPTISSMDSSFSKGGEGVSAELKCLIKGEPTPGVVWYKDGQLVQLSGEHG